MNSYLELLARLDALEEDLGRQHDQARSSHDHRRALAERAVRDADTLAVQTAAEAATALRSARELLAELGMQDLVPRRVHGVATTATIESARLRIQQTGLRLGRDAAAIARHREMAMENRRREAATADPPAERQERERPEAAAAPRPPADVDSPDSRRAGFLAFSIIAAGVVLTLVTGSIAVIAIAAAGGIAVAAPMISRRASRRRPSVAITHEPRRRGRKE